MQDLQASMLGSYEASLECFPVEYCEHSLLDLLLTCYMQPSAHRCEGTCRLASASIACHTWCGAMQSFLLLLHLVAVRWLVLMADWSMLQAHCSQGVSLQRRPCHNLTWGWDACRIKAQARQWALHLTSLTSMAPSRPLHQVSMLLKLSCAVL